ncbi:MAG TPA: N-6 DNA methylase [Chitinophagaceae bacterium]|nr:N-6 DNA methylase [Chitinophagaceae bacterium]
MIIQEYINNINKRFKTGISREHSYRGDLQTVLENIVTDVLVTNEPARIACGAPDYILTKKNIPVGYIEAKDIGIDLNSKSLKEQFDRYKASLNNLIFTNYIDFHLYIDGIFKTSVNIATIQDGHIIPITENYTSFQNLIQNFCTHIGQTIKSPKKLAEMMAGKARMLSEVIEKALTTDETNQEDSTLKDQMHAFKEILIHDITPKGFADVYAQTIAYGMFAARLHDPTLPSFSRQEAAELIPKSNPFLRKLFSYIAGPDIDDRIKWIVDSLVEIFLACNVQEILKNYGKTTKTEDPIIHFYETFLSEYDPKLRKARGVWYTPAPVVNFIVRAVDDILKTEFDLPNGLADNSKTKIDLPNPSKGGTYKQEVHKVQILDPATGTGTFLAEVVKHIYKQFEGQQGIWSNYVETHLLPRLNGFELLMASYAMAHLKLDLLLTETGYKPTTNQRFRVYLTNSLEEHHQDTGTLFANWLSAEANEANHIKRDTPVMVIMGNPPYSGESSNKGEWIMNLMEDYKKEPGGKEKLKERNPKWINDDYVKFLRYGQYFIEKNGSGVLAFINPHGFLDNPTFRGMRWNLLKTYDKIYTIDLHGNSRKKETAPDGSVDVNVFDIMQGVSINLFVKTGKKKSNELGKVFHFDLFGKREFKYDFLIKNSIKTIPYIELENSKPDYLFVQKDYGLQSLYNNMIGINELFFQNKLGIFTHRDGFLIDIEKAELGKRINKFASIELDEIKKQFGLKSTRDWSLEKAFVEIKKEKIIIEKYNYRLFDTRYICYNQIMFDRGCSRYELMRGLLNPNEYALNTSRNTQKQGDFSDVFVSNNLTDSHYCTGGNYVFPLYLYPEINAQQTIGQTDKRTPNLNLAIVNKIAEKLDLTFTNEPFDYAQGDIRKTFAPIDILDYIYAVLHSPTYREKYKEFLKIDFPRVPYPKDKETFWKLVKLGGEIRQIHLLESPTADQYITQYPIDGSNIVTKPKYQDGKVFINDIQYFDNVPQIAWNFYIGGYQPAQKWLKDRKDRKLEFEDILHYQKIIVALTETDRLMKEIDKIEME